MIIRLIAIDPEPDPTRSDVLCYQVPENSRELKLLEKLFTDHNIEYEVICFPKRTRNGKPTVS